MSKILEVAPLLRVADVEKAAAYYTGKLGFTVHRFWGNPPAFCIPERDGVHIMLSNSEERSNTNSGSFDAYFWVKDGDDLFSEFTEKGAEISKPPRDEPYGMREFEVRDLDDHVLVFGYDIPAKAT